VIRNISLNVDLIGIIILNLGPKCFNVIYWNSYVQGEMKYHKVQKDNHEIKSDYQGKDVMNKVTVYGLWSTTE
jgi:hypothetical protein